MVIAFRRAVPIAAFAFFEDAVTTDGRAVVVRKGVASSGAAAVITGASINGCVITLNIAIGDRAGLGINGARVIVVAIFRAIPVA